MPTDNDNVSTASPDAELSAAGLPAAGSIWVNCANAVMAAYNAYTSSTTPSLPGYQYVASIWVQESAEEVDAEAAGPATTAAAAVETAVGTPEGFIQGNTLMGFAAYADDRSHNLIVLRGTSTAEEAGYDLYGWGTNTPCMLPSNNPVQNYGNVKQDLYNFYMGTNLGLFVSLAQSFNMAVRQVAQANPGKPWIVTAHSLGGALATLGALDAYVSGSYIGSSSMPYLITFGSLHIGDQSFVDACNQRVKPSYRVANLCDFVPSLVSLEPGTPKDPYVHVGVEATFIWQKWDDWANHSMEFTYLPTVTDYFNVIHFGPRQYPQ